MIKRSWAAPSRLVLGMAGAFLIGAAPLGAVAQTFVPGNGTDKSQAPPPTKQPSKDELRDEGQQLFGPGKAKSAPGQAPTWSIVIVAFRGDDRDAAAAKGLAKVKQETWLTDAYLERRGEASVVAYGHYDDPASKQARGDLERIKNMEVVVNGAKTRPLSLAFLAPPEQISGTIPEYDLRNARKQDPDALYTLQIGVYSREDGKSASAAEQAEFRKTAEQAVVQLRHEGEMAFYYHGPHRSMVTVGLLGKDDFDPQAPGVESAALKALRARYPYNLLNGMGIRRTTTMTNEATKAQVKKQKLESSALVGVPKD